MEKLIRSLSESTALLLGVIILVALLLFAILFSNTFISDYFGGFIPIIILTAVLVGSIGFAVPLIFKGIIGKTPQEKRESQK
ncbi:hypothetical protein BH18ACI1_BH18ACI1_00170 [soil metagenome]